MRILIIKTSSMGDVIHTLPAITDAARAHSDLSIDWVVEENFAAIPSWHPSVNQVIPVALRRWRKQFWRHLFGKQWRAAKQQLGQQHYDAVIDAQGLLKSAFLSRYTHGPCHGLNWGSAREPLASMFYQHRHAIAKTQHAVERTRALFAKALNYSLPTTLDYGLTRAQFNNEHESSADYLLILHGTTWQTKQWPEQYWLALIHLALKNKLAVKIAWGGPTELARAKRLQAGAPEADVLPDLNIAQMAPVIANAKYVVAVDTGFAHLAAALSVPTISIYGATDPTKTGTLGAKQIHLAADFACAPCLSKSCHYQQASQVKPACYESLSPQRVWDYFSQIS